MLKCLTNPLFMDLEILSFSCLFLKAHRHLKALKPETVKFHAKNSHTAQSLGLLPGGHFLLSSYYELLDSKQQHTASWGCLGFFSHWSHQSQTSSNLLTDLGIQAKVAVTGHLPRKPCILAQSAVVGSPDSEMTLF